MGYAFEREEPVPVAVRRIMEEQIGRAAAQLADESAAVEIRIHDARKRFKETRALLRLVREPLGAQFGIENAWFRDAGRDLSGARDAAAVLESLEKLATHATLSRTTLRRARAFLRERHDALRTAGDLEGRIANVMGQLGPAQARLDDWPRLDDSFDTIAGGLLTTYRRGKRAMDLAAAGRLPHQFHEWRKRAKEHWYHAQLLRHVWPDVMKTWAGVLSDLSRTLGDQHDLVVLRQTLAASHARIGRRSSVIALLDTIDARQRELESAALETGSRVYAESPRAWLARIRNLWTAWRS